MPGWFRGDRHWRTNRRHNRKKPRVKGRTVSRVSGYAIGNRGTTLEEALIEVLAGMTEVNMAGERDDRGEEQEVYVPKRPQESDDDSHDRPPGIERELEDHTPIPERG